MRSVNTDYPVETTDESLAQLAAEFAERGMDERSGLGVGATAVVNYRDDELHQQEPEDSHRHIYAGFNINISGMEYKLHAEQLALFQVALDIELANLQSQSDLEKVVVVTTDHDYSLVCGHCLHVARSFCEHYNWNSYEVDYIAAAYEGSEENIDNFHLSDWGLERETIADLLPETYTSKRD